MKYRKKPVEIEAWQISPTAPEPQWVKQALIKERIDWCPAGEGLYVNTPEGCMKGAFGDWLIEGIKGELYPCRDDIFTETYEPVLSARAE